MTVPYTKTNVGNKLFVIEWDLELTDPLLSAEGSHFEAVDCELLSIHATTIGEGAITKMNFTNKSSGGVAISLSSPSNNQIIPSPLPPVRFYVPTLEEAEATATIALLFKEI
jgi:hypothetical protein